MDSAYYSQSQNTGSLVSLSDNVQAGHIVKIQMKNFMCHDNLEVTLNSRINFVVGKNGSGKSAIQTAIAVGLGGKALTTNRGSSLKALIKNDKNSCTIMITISNQGLLAYNPQEYGRFIKVERLFSQTTQSYKIRNAQDKIVSTEKRELDRIVAHFNIQTENPLCILHQDVARNFLSSSDPKNKYKFYLKASRLDDITHLYTESMFRVHAVKEAINSKSAVLKEAFSDVIEMKKKIKTMEDAIEKQKRCEHLENELIWAKVHETNLELQELMKRKEIEIIAKNNTNKKLKDVEKNNIKDKLRDLEERIKEKDELVENAKDKLAEAKEDYKKKRENLAICSTKLTEAKQCVRLNRNKYENCMKEIDNLTKNAPEKKLQQENLKKEISQLEEDLKSLKAAEQSFEHDKQQLNDTVDVANQTLQTITNQYHELMRIKRKKEDQLKQLLKSTNNLSVYGDVMVVIIEEINKSHRKFSKKPIGPIGMHIKVRDPAWAGAVENFLGKGTLSSFCVDNSRDSTTLSDILRNICTRFRSSQPPIICSKFINSVHAIEGSETGTRKYMNLARALDIDNPVVANCLIDQQEVETVLLIPTNNEAYQIMDEANKVPQNCRRAFTLTGDQFYPAPNYKSYSSQRPVSQAMLLQTNQEDLISQLRVAIRNQDQEINVVERKRQNAQAQVSSTLDSLRKNEVELKNLKKRRLTMEQKIRELQNSVEPENQTNIGYFIEESKELQKKLEEEANKLKNLKKKCEDMQIKFDEADTIHSNLLKTITDSYVEKAPIQGEIQRLKSILQQASTKADLMKERIKEHDRKLGNIDSEITELTGQLTQSTENASQICDPINTERATEEINRELKSVQLYLKKLEEQSGGSLAELQRNLKDRQQSFDAITNNLNGLMDLVKKTKNSLTQRKGRKVKLQHILMTSAKHNFQSFLNERNFDGKLEFDLENKTLEIKVKPVSEADPTAKRLDTASLSGGEKSFSTVCFIMALWLELELPFHFLDEFDVFMDGINRRIVIDLLLSHAKRYKQQFVFLTPLDTSSIPVSDIITVHRLEAPRN